MLAAHLHFREQNRLSFPRGSYWAPQWSQIVLNRVPIPMHVLEQNRVALETGWNISSHQSHGRSASRLARLFD